MGTSGQGHGGSVYSIINYDFRSQLIFLTVVYVHDGSGRFVFKELKLSIISNKTFFPSIFIIVRV